MKNKITAFLLPLSLLFFPPLAFAAQRTRGWRGMDGLPDHGYAGFMWDNTGKPGPWFWVFAGYRIIIGVLILIILIQLAVLLWKKVESTKNHGETEKVRDHKLK